MSYDTLSPDTVELLCTDNYGYWTITQGTQYTGVYDEDSRMYMIYDDKLGYRLYPARLFQVL